MSWRFQVVYRDDAAGRCYSFCEAHFDERDRLKYWTESCEMWPGGEDIGELQRDLVRMYVDAARWKAVPFDSLRPGIKFERLITQDQAESVAQMFDLLALKTAPEGMEP